MGLKHETLYFQIQFINLICLSEKMKVIKSKVTFDRRLNFKKQNYDINAEVKKKNHQSKLYAENKSSVAKEEKLKKKMKAKLKFSRNKYEKLYLYLDHVIFGPCCICTICHQCLYSRSVRIFSMVSYKDFVTDFVTKATYDKKVCVCVCVYGLAI